MTNYGKITISTEFVTVRIIDFEPITNYEISLGDREIVIYVSAGTLILKIFVISSSFPFE